MDGYRPIDRQLIDACQEYPPDFIKIRGLLAQGADVNAVSASDPDETLLGGIIYAYPQILDLQDACEGCEDENCEGCSLHAIDPDGKYLPQIVQFFLENGFDPSREDGRAGARALSSLILSSRDLYILDACKLLLSAGADPQRPCFIGEDETSISWAATEASFNACEQHHVAENLYETLYQIMDAAVKGRNFWLIEPYQVCLGRRLDSIFLYSEGSSQGIFPVNVPTSHHPCSFRDTIVLDCAGKPLRISHYADILVDPHIPQDATEKLDLARWFPDCLGHTITAIDFGHNDIADGRIHYGQPSIRIHLDNGKVLIFSTNHGEVAKEDMVGWFQLR